MAGRRTQPRKHGKFSNVEGPTASRVIGVRVPTQIKTDFDVYGIEKKEQMRDRLCQYITLAVACLPQESEVRQEYLSRLELTASTSKILGIRVPEAVKQAFDQLERWQRSRILEGTRCFLLHLLETGGVDESGYLDKRKQAVEEAKLNSGSLQSPRKT